MKRPRLLELVMAALVAASLPVVVQAYYAWDATKPGTGGALVSGDIRSNWNAIATTLAGVNLVADPTYLIWPAGDAAAPAHWTLNGSPTVARTGTGLGDTKRKVGAFALKLTSGVGTGSARQNILASGSYDDGYDGLTFSWGVWVWASAASAARAGINDGIGTSYCLTSVAGCTGFHTGNSTWQWLTGNRVIDASATQVFLTLDCAASQTCYFSAPTVVLGEVPPAYFQAPPTQILEHRCFISGVQTTGTRKVGSGCDFYFARPAIVKNVSVGFTTVVPSGQAYIVDINHYDGAAFQSMYSTRPQVAAGVAVGSPAAPDTTYRYRCFDAFQTNSQTDRLMTVDVDQIGSGNAGTDATIIIRYEVFSRPLEAFLVGTSYN